MLASAVNIKDMKTSVECWEAIEQIESDRRNSNGNWFDGSETTLKSVASRKIAALNAKADKLLPDDV